jgi:hypothetical protein
MNLNKRLVGAAALSLASLFGVPLAQASVSTQLNLPITADPTPGLFDFTYSVTLSTAEQIVNGSYFTLYDVGPLAGPITTTGLMSTNWAFSQALTGPTPAGALPTDKASVLNLTATYNGTTTLAPASGAVGNLGTFTIVSLASTYVLANEVGSAQLRTSPHFADTSIEFDGVPSPVPLPGALPLFATGLAGLGMLGWRKRRKAAATA